MNVTSLATELGITKQCLFSYLWRHKYRIDKIGRDAVLTQDQILTIRGYYNNKNNFKRLELTPRQLEIVIGSLLGDGNLRNPPRGDSSFRKTQCRRRRDYLEWHVKELGLFSKPLYDGTKLAPTRNGNKITTNEIRILEHTDFYTRNSHVFTELRNKWYKDNIKIVPSDVELSPLVIAVWYCDDGYNDVKRKQIRISTNAFTFNEVELLVSKLKVSNLFFNIQCVGKKPVMNLSRKSYIDFIDIITPYVVCNSMQYKLKIVRPYLVNSQAH